MKKSIIALLPLLWMQSLSAQTLEPKLYANTPVGAMCCLWGISIPDMVRIFMG